MEYKKKPVITEPMKTTRILIYDYSNKIMQGSLYNLYYGKEIVFNSMMEFLLQMEKLMDDMQYPQANTQMRLAYRKNDLYEETRKHVLAPMATSVKMQFYIKVLFRQNSSWQGIISWGKDKREKPFRSVLELMMLMDNILCRERLDTSESDSTVNNVGVV